MRNTNKSIIRIRKALLSLLDKQAFKEIKVNHLVGEAGISRATFYLHFSSKEEVLIDYIDAMFDAYFEEIEHSLSHTSTINEQLSNRMFEVFKDDADFSRVLLQDAVYPIILKRFKGYLARIVGHVTRNNRRFEVPDAQLSYLIDYWAGGSLLLIQRWVSNDFQPGIDEMANLYSKLTISGMKALLPEDADDL